MIVISHRGNLDGPDVDTENHPDTIDRAIKSGFDVEIDVRLVENEWWLGHDEPQYQVDWQWLLNRKNRLWVHTKNISALSHLNVLGLSPYHKHRTPNVHYFWHEKDTVALTSRGFLWAYPNSDTPENAIAVMPEIAHGDLSRVLGVCTDYPRTYI